MQNRPRHTKQPSQELRSRSMKRQHPAVKWQQPSGIFEFGHGNRAGYDCNCPHPVRHCRGRCVRIGSAARNCEHPKFANTQVIENSFYNVRPIGQFSIALQTRSADARSIR